MRFNGEWLQCDDGIERPVIRAEILSGRNVWRAAEFLVDTGADRTVFSANVLALLHLKTSKPQTPIIGGVGGLADSVTVSTQIRLTGDDNVVVAFRGDYAACTDHEALDMSILGRDIMDRFAVIADQRGDVVTMIAEPHRYKIEIS
jgi:hypothetical protein